MNKFRAALAGAFFAALAVPAGAASISLITGVDGGGTLSAGSTDSNWQISVQGGAYEDATVAYPAQICCNMGTITEGAWLTDSSVTSGSSSTGWGFFTDAFLKTSFDLSGADLTTAVLTGSFRVADFINGIYLNGNLIPGSDGGYSAWGFDTNLAAVTSGFVDGVNELVMVGQSGNSQWDGFWFSGEVTYDLLNGDDDDISDVPLPAGFPLLLAGLGALGVMRRRRG